MNTMHSIFTFLFLPKFTFLFLPNNLDFFYICYIFVNMDFYIK